MDLRVPPSPVPADDCLICADLKVSHILTPWSLTSSPPLAFSPTHPHAPSAWVPHSLSSQPLNPLQPRGPLLSLLYHLSAQSLSCFLDSPSTASTHINPAVSPQFHTQRGKENASSLTASLTANRATKLKSNWCFPQTQATAQCSLAPL